eukprot:CAMPEP_0198208524 /NCGR_PEP_ID=MMETSP1445-20131203/11875_1 /TAXON_ID=36898 /ORGANISM="Pyramimonas sp., Strain CCMP2087" /LENGTH=436 /DNA_ID=CAMNT_0043881949 /DNA_START=272 /DNA_END=1582 /DNA_ORIENTATION=-
MTIFGIAKEHEAQRLLFAANCMALQAGMLNGLTWISPITATTSSHMTGTVAKGAIWIAENELKAKGGPALALATSFFAGSLTSGMLTGFPRYNNLTTLSHCILYMSVMLFVAAVLMTEGYSEAKYIVAYVNGLQNAMLTSATGFARTTHVTGTITDIGILIGHSLNKKVRGNKSHWWKCRALITLLANLMFGGVVAYWLYAEDYLALEEDAFFVPASISLVFGLLGHAHVWQGKQQDKRQQLEEEECKHVNEEIKEASAHNPSTEPTTHNPLMSNNMASTVMKELTEETPNVESMPEEPGALFRKVVQTAGIVHFIRKQTSNTQQKLAQALERGQREKAVAELFEFLLTKEDIMEELKATKPHLVTQLETTRNKLQNEVGKTPRWSHANSDVSSVDYQSRIPTTGNIMLPPMKAATFMRVLHSNKVDPIPPASVEL